MKKKLIYPFAVFFVIVNLVWWFQLGGDRNEIVEDLLYLVAAIATIAGGIFATFSYGFKSPHGKSIGLMTIGFSCWLMGEAIWVLYETVLHIDPYPSFADIFFVLGYPLIGWGIVKEIRLASLKLGNVNKLVLLGIGILSVLFLIAVSYFEIILAFVPGATILENFAIFYGFADLVILFPVLFVLAMAWEYKGGKIFVPWVFLFMGLIFAVAADTLYAVFLGPYLDGTYPYESLDLLWISGYLLDAIGFFWMGSLIYGIKKRIQK